MKILTMTATFGCLDEATLHLSDGVNLLCLSNESGKSTWAAFLQAMFYGIDTSQRASKGILPEKARWQPWNGKAMCGTVELEHRGRRMILQRTSQRGRPMSVFRAYDPETGLEISELTGENCGRYFFGVEKSVFQRCAFLSGSELAVTEDQKLARRLENLAVSGAMGDSYPAADAKLKQWKNRCRYHQNGLIPETEAKLRQAEGRLERLTELRHQAMETTSAYKACWMEANELEQAEKQRRQQRIDAAEKKLADANARWIREQETMIAARDWRELIPDKTLRKLYHAALQLRQNPLPPRPECPPALQGIDAEVILSKAQRDQAEYEQLQIQAKKLGDLRLRLCWIGVLLVIVAAVGKIWWAMALCLIGAAASFLLCRGSAAKKRQAAEGLLRSYGVQDKDSLLAEAVKQRDWLLARERNRTAGWEAEALFERLADTGLLGDLSAEKLMTEVLTPEAIEEELECRRHTPNPEEALELAKEEYHQAAASWHPSPELMQLREKAAGLKVQAESLRQQEEDNGGLETAAYRREQLQKELDDLYRREQALELAREALESAHSQLEQVYAPQLTGLAGEYLQKLTGNRYDALVLGRDWQLQARETATGLTRPLASLSSGTQDQVWLALRLAMAELLLPEASPLVLDDALLTLDDKRTELAVALLRQTGRQVILFSCRTL